jgi:hypothetical protein
MAISTLPLSPALHALADLGLPLSCACSTVASLSCFHRFARRPGLFAALSPYAYGVYLCHYFFVSWLQLGLLAADLPGAAKALAVFAGGSLLSLGATLLWRRVRVVRPQTARPQPAVLGDR